MKINNPTHTIPSFYAPVDDTQRDALLQVYVDYLHTRNGALDPQTGVLPLRETSLNKMNTSEVRYNGQLSQAQFSRVLREFGRFDLRDLPQEVRQRGFFA